MRPPCPGIEADVESDPPPGFIERPPRGAFTRLNGPLFLKRDASGFRLGLRVQDRHCNGLGIVHGGMVLTVADVLFTAAVQEELEGRFVTVQLNGNLLAPVRRHCWVEGTAWVNRAARSLIFVEGEMRVGGRRIFHGTAIFKPVGERL